MRILLSNGFESIKIISTAGLDQNHNNQSMPFIIGVNIHDNLLFARF